MNLLRLFIIALVGLTLSIIFSGCSSPDSSTGNVYPGARARPDGSPVPALSYTNEPQPWGEGRGAREEL